MEFCTCNSCSSRIQELLLLEDTIKKLFGDLGFDKTPLELLHKAHDKMDGLEYHIEQLDKELKQAETRIDALTIGKDCILIVTGLLPLKEDEENIIRSIKICNRQSRKLIEHLEEVRARKAEKP